MNREKLNAAIGIVVTSKFKKDAPEAFAVVAKAGYECFKNGSSEWEIYNPATKRRIWLTTARRGWGSDVRIIHGMYCNNVANFDTEDAAISKFDFVGCLDKPLNTEYYRCTRLDGKKTAVEKYDELKFKKRMMLSYDEDLTKIAEKIKKLQDELVRAACRRESYSRELADLRKELGLA